jgi:hypothetical protein
MVTTKVNGLEIAVGKESGVVYRRSGTSKMPRDVITWQDIDDLRIWIHSRELADGHKPVSIEIQTVGAERHPDGVDPMEAKARVALAAVIPADLRKSRISHGQMRNLQIGHIMHMNSVLIENERARAVGKKDRKLKLVNTDEEQYRTLEIAITQNGKKVAVLTNNMRANKADSILIAYLYAQFASTGNKKAASNTAQMLGIDSKFVYTALRNARKNGWLTTSGIGSSGGELTASGKKEFEKAGRSRYEEIVKLMMEGKK